MLDHITNVRIGMYNRDRGTIPSRISSSISIIINLKIINLKIIPYRIKEETYTHQNHNETSPFKEYIISLYWASATMTSTGYGDITPHETPEYIAAIICEAGGLLLFGYCLSAIAATLANLDAPR